MAKVDAQGLGYNHAVEDFRDVEYPMCRDKIYLDHGGSTIYAKSLIEMFSADLMSNLYGNPHSDSAPAQQSSLKIERVRQRILAFVNADPEDFDVVFTANATAAIKLVMDSFRDLAAASSSTVGNGPGQFWYGYHRDAHTSLVGVREATNGLHTCFTDDDEVERWLDGKHSPSGLPQGKCNGGRLGLFGYPGQSNMTGRRLPLDWCGRLRQSPQGDYTYSLLDAAALSTTAPIDIGDVSTAPDFVALSFYKIFGFPDIGALIVRKDSGHILQWRRYFGGGTVDMVTVLQEQWHSRKDYTTDSHYDLHDQLEDGTLPFHSIVALDAAFDAHTELFGTMKRISAHTQYLIRKLHATLSTLCHYNGSPLATIYNDAGAVYGDPNTQGATIAFNLLTPMGELIPYPEVESRANDKGIYVRTGGLCNPGGVATHLRLAPWEMKRAWSAGHRCGHGMPNVGGKATGVVRVSLGAMSTRADIEGFLDFVKAEFVDEDMMTRADLGVLPTLLTGTEAISATEVGRPSGVEGRVSGLHDYLEIGETEPEPTSLSSIPVRPQMALPPREQKVTMSGMALTSQTSLQSLGLVSLKEGRQSSARSAGRRRLAGRLAKLRMLQTNDGIQCW